MTKRRRAVGATTPILASTRTARTRTTLDAEGEDDVEGDGWAPDEDDLIFRPTLRPLWQRPWW